MVPLRDVGRLLLLAALLGPLPRAACEVRNTLHETPEPPGGLTATDPVSQRVNLALSQINPELRFNAATGILRWTPPSNQPAIETQLSPENLQRLLTLASDLERRPEPGGFSNPRQREAFYNARSLATTLFPGPPNRAFEGLQALSVRLTGIPAVAPVAGDGANPISVANMGSMADVRETIERWQAVERHPERKYFIVSPTEGLWARTIGRRVTESLIVDPGGRFTIGPVGHGTAESDNFLTMARRDYPNAARWDIVGHAAPYRVPISQHFFGTR
ncbi:MAG: hypothetical protein HY078_02995 [Elusimicrobia bacterium]|nr:hypothetical protein [Elusimicrobiota bacterium]